MSIVFDGQLPLTMLMSPELLPQHSLDLCLGKLQKFGQYDQRLVLLVTYSYALTR